MKRTDGDFWKILDFTFLEGRPYSTDEVVEAAFVGVINRATKEKFFADAPAEGQTLEVDGQRFRVIGVVENVSAFRDVPFADIWTPYTTAKSDTYRTGITGNFNAMVLASNRTALSQIRDEFNARLSRIDRAEFPDPKAYTTIVAPFDTKFETFARSFDPIADRRDPERQGWRLIVAFGGLALLFILLPTVNLVNMNTSRILERASEIGVRKAFGASGGALVTQFIVENLILTMLGGLDWTAAVAIRPARDQRKRDDRLFAVWTEHTGLLLRAIARACVRGRVGCLSCLANVASSSRRSPPRR